MMNPEGMRYKAIVLLDPFLDVQVTYFFRRQCHITIVLTSLLTISRYFYHNRIRLQGTLHTPNLDQCFLIKAT
jgi:hypothetical protein